MGAVSSFLTALAAGLTDMAAGAASVVVAAGAAGLGAAMLSEGADLATANDGVSDLASAATTGSSVNRSLSGSRLVWPSVGISSIEAIPSSSKSSKLK